MNLMTNEMTNAKIDTDELAAQVEKLKKERDLLNDYLEQIEKNTNILKDHWDTKTSESVFYNFEDMYKGFNEFVGNLNSDIEFLEKIIADYKTYELIANKEIDETITA